MTESHGQWVYLVSAIADLEHPTLAEIKAGVDLTDFIVEGSVIFGEKPTPPAAPRKPFSWPDTIASWEAARPKVINGEVVEPVNRAERRALERRRRHDNPE